MTSSAYKTFQYIRMDESTREHSHHAADNTHQTPRSLQDKLYDTITLRQAQPPSPSFCNSLLAMSSSNNQPGQGQASRGSNTPTSTPPQAEAQTQTTTEQYPDHAAYNSSGSLQRAGAGVMQQQLGQYYLYMSNTQSTTGQSGRGSPARSQEGQSNSSSQGR